MKTESSQVVFTEEFYHGLFNNMLHGFSYCKVVYDNNRRVIDYTHLIVNDLYESLIGFTGIKGKNALELMPDLEDADPDYLQIITQVILTGKPARFESYVPRLDRWFSISIYSPNKDYFVVLLDNVTEQKNAQAKITKLNRLYAFISQVNQTIVHVKDEETLFKKACEIALTFGKFKMAWIGKIDSKEQKITVVEERGMAPEDVILFTNTVYEKNSPAAQVLQTGASFICNEIAKAGGLINLKAYAAKRDIGSAMVLPLKKGGKVVATFNLYSSTPGFFDKEEIGLLEEAAGDVSFAMDIFEKEKLRIRIEKKVEESEQNLKAIFENTSEGFVLMDTNFVVKAFNNNAKRFSLLNSETDIAVGDNVFNNFEKSRFEVLRSMMARVLNGEGVQYERAYDLKNGTKAWFSFLMNPVRENNRITGLCVTGQDITEKKRAEEEREFDANNLKSLINNTNDLMWSVDRKFKLITFNSAFAEIVKALSGEIPEKGASVLSKGFSAEKLQRFKERYERAFAGETFTEMEESESYVSEISFYPIFNANEIIGTACYSRDITEKKKAEERLRKSESDLKSANKDLETFIYRASHDLRGPLSSIMGLTNVSKMEIQDKKAQVYIDMIQLSTKKLDDTLVGLVQSMAIKDVSKFEDDIEFKNMIEDVFDRFQYYDGFARIKFDVAVNLKQPFISSRQILQPIIQNLIENSIKYQNINTDKAFARITISDTENEVMLVFEDNGMGMDSSIQDKVFDVYYKGTQKSKGSGLGLYIVKTGVERLKGNIRLKSVAGMGSTFIITLPRTPGIKRTKPV